MKEARFKIGHKFLKGNREKHECIIIDILKTYNSDEELVEIRYECQHNFLGQTITHIEGDTTIARGSLNENGQLRI